jgi:hypothetical protein
MVNDLAVKVCPTLAALGRHPGDGRVALIDARPAVQLWHVTERGAKIDGQTEREAERATM